MLKRIGTVLVALCMSVILFSGCQKEPEKIMWIEDLEVYSDEYELYLNNEKLAISQATGLSYEEVKTQHMGGAEDSPTYEEQAAENAKSMLLYNKMSEILYREYGLEKESEIESEAEKRFANRVEWYGDEKTYTKLLKENGLSKDEQMDYFRAGARSKVVADAVFGPGGEQEISEKVITDDLRLNHYLIKPIILYKVDDLGNTLPNAQLEEKKRIYEEIRSKIEAGEPFDPLMEQYNEEPLTAEEKERGQLIGMLASGNDNLKAVLYNAEDGPYIYSEDEVAYYVIQKLETDPNSDWQREQAREERITKAFAEWIEEQLTQTSYYFYI